MSRSTGMSSTPVKKCASARAATTAVECTGLLARQITATGIPIAAQRLMVVRVTVATGAEAARLGRVWGGEGGGGARGGWRRGGPPGGGGGAGAGAGWGGAAGAGGGRGGSRSWF